MQTPDGQVWTPAAFPYSYWQRYFHNVFDEVRVIARVAQQAEPPESSKRADGEGVTFTGIPSYIGPVQYLLNLRAIKKAAQEAAGRTDAVILRVGSQIGSCIEAALEANRPFAVEVVTDPYNIFAPGSVDHPLRPAFRWYFTKALKRQCRKACAAGYVTDRFLQQRYPPGKSTFHTSYAATELDADAIASTPRSFERHSGPVCIISVGSLAQLYKGVDVLIDAVAECIEGGADLELLVVGDGQYRPDLEGRAERHGIASHVKFLGAIPSGKPVRDQLDSADLFILVSKTEGLPGAMIEAMARALPCIGSAVGGIPELLPPEYLVPRGDSKALALKIKEIVADRKRMTEMSATNLSRAQAYGESILAVRRRELLLHLRDRTEQWLKGKAEEQTSKETQARRAVI